MERFADRRAAGRALAARMGGLGGPEAIVLALPRGGLPVADEVARALGAALDVVLVRKIGMPGNRERALGAIAGPEGGTMVLNEALVHAFGIEPEVIEAQAAPERVELARRRKLWGAGLAPGALKGKRVILVDDGIATGAAAQGVVFSRDSRRIVAQLYADRCLAVYEVSGESLSDTGVRIAVDGGPASLRRG